MIAWRRASAGWPARALGAAELALDTAEGATALRAMYTRAGFRIVGSADWRPTTNYRSVVMSRTLLAP